MKRIALITGATSGIGLATARLLAKNYALIVCGRRVDRLEALSQELSAVTDVLTLSFDARDNQAVQSALRSRPAAWQNIDVLLNNAGNAHGLSSFQDGNIADWDNMIDINVKGLLYISREITPQMVARKTGHIINIGSIAGIDVYPNGNVYNASKFAVDAITQGMRKDLYTYGIKVSEIKPGLVETEFSEVRFKGDQEKASKVYQGFDPLQAVDVAETIEFILSRPQHVNIADVLILPKAQAASTMVHKNFDN